MKSRKHISLKTKLAAALRCMMVEQDGKLVPAISYEDAKGMTEDQVLTLFNFDHGIHHVISQNDEHWNLTPRFIAEHRAKTATVDRPMIAKSARLTEAHIEFQRRMLSKTGQADEGPQGKPKSRFPTRKMQSRPFPKKAPRQ